MAQPHGSPLPCGRRAPWLRNPWAGSSGAERSSIRDHERVLWNERSQEALKTAGFTVLQNYPADSPDLNAIEAWWARLKKRLEETAPAEIEKRADFVKRLRKTVTWMNDNLQDEALALCTNQKERANAVKNLRGAFCRW